MLVSIKTVCNYLIVLLILISGSTLSAQYCLPVYAFACSSGDFIDDVSFISINNTGTACTGLAPNNYTDYSSTFSTTAAQNASYAITVKPGIQFDQYFGAWIDFNQDGDFTDPGEYFNLGYALAGTALISNITIPGSANTGTTRLRILCRFGPTPLLQSDVCSTTLDFGEVEDYALNIIPPPAKDAAFSTVLSPFSGCSLGNTEIIEVEVLNLGLDTLFSFDVCFTLNGGSNICELVNDTLVPGDTLQYIFTSLANLSVPGIYEFDFWVNQSGDGNSINDSLPEWIVNSIPLVSTFPYVQDFENGMGGWSSDGNFNSWEFGMPIDTFIDTTASGVNAWVTNLSGLYNNDENSTLTSPCFDFSIFSADPELRFSQIFITEQCCDAGWVETSINGGNTWNKLGLSGSGSNWYNDAINNEWDGASGMPGQWRIASHTLNGTAGQSDVRIRFVFNADFSINEEGFGIDDIFIYDTLWDAKAATLIFPKSECVLSDSESVSFEIHNLGTDTIFSLPVCFSVNAGATQCDTILDTIPPGTSHLHIFNNTADLSAFQVHQIRLITLLNNDDYSGNDTMNILIENIQPINTFPYKEDFDSWAIDFQDPVNTKNYWVNDPNDNGQDWWVNNVPTLSAGTGPNQDHTSGSGNYLFVEDSGFDNDSINLISPCIDLDGISACLGFWIHSNESNGGGGAANNTLYVEVWDGVVWTPIDTLSHIGLTWQYVQNDLAAFKNNVIKIRFRSNNNNLDFTHDIAIDDFEILRKVALNAATIGISTPEEMNCGLAQTSICVRIKNNGLDTLFGNIPVSYNAGMGVVNELISDTIAPGDTTLYCFDSLANLNALGWHNLLAWTALPSDSIALDDSTNTQIFNAPLIDSFPYQEDFESGDGYWTSGGANNSWEFGMPTNTFIDSASSGVNAWVTGLTGDYNQNENSFLQSPCLDFSSLIKDPMLVFAHIFNTEQCCDHGWVELSTDGGIAWSKLGTTSNALNWYNDTLNNQWNGSTGLTGNWRKAAHLIDGVAGESDVKLRYFFSSDAITSEEGFGVDDIGIFDTLVNAAVSKILLPVSGCDLSMNDTVRVLLKNFGTDTLFNIPICFTVNAGTPICENFFGAIAPGDSAIFSFSSLANFSLPGQYNLAIYTTLPRDTIIPENDSLFAIITHIPTISNFPYQEDFENGEAGWTSHGINNSWAFGTPSKTTINTAASGINSWTTGGLGITQYNPNENSWVLSPCFDFSGLSNPGISMNVWWNSESTWDGSALQYSTDNGSNWISIGAAGNPFNWYNDTAVLAMSPFLTNDDGWSGTSALGNGSSAWVKAKHDLAVLSGKMNVQLRIAFAADAIIQDDGFAFDDVLIADAPIVYLGPDTAICDSLYLLDPGLSVGQFSWSTGDTTPVISIDSSGIYSLTYTDTNGICQIDSILINISGSAPLLDLGNDTTICTLDTICLNSNGDPVNTYNWNNGATTPIICVSQPGTYYLSCTNVGGCVAEDSIIVSNVAAPVPSLSADTSQCPLVSFTDLSTGGAIANWFWDFGDGNGSNQQNPSNVYGAGGSYNVKLIVSNACATNSITFQIELLCIIGIEKQLFENISLFPNPNSGNFVVSLQNISMEDVTCELFNTDAKLIWSKSYERVSSNIDISIDSKLLSVGIYYFVLRNESGSWKRKLLIQH